MIAVDNSVYNSANSNYSDEISLVLQQSKAITIEEIEFIETAELLKCFLVGFPTL